MVNVICVKWGDKYNSEDVNRLYKMVSKNLTRPFSFYCLTEDFRGLQKEIITLNIDHELFLDSYWWKMCIFDKALYREDAPTLYLDLDTIIQKNIDHFFDMIEKNKIRSCYTDILDQDIGEELAPDGSKFKHRALINSSIMGFIPSTVHDVFEKFISLSDYYILEYQGVCRYLTKEESDRLSFFYWKKDWYSANTIHQDAHNKIIHDLPGFFSKYRKQILRENDRPLKYYYMPEVPICILNSSKFKGIYDELLEIFFKYYK